VFDGPPRVTNADMPEPPHPVNWNLLTAHELEQEWLALNRWVDWLRRTYGLQVAVIRRSGITTRDGLGTLGAAPALARCLRPRAERVRTARLAPRLRRRPPATPLLGHRLRHSWDRDRPTRQAAWPGEEPAPASRT
jgi:hypothetical protein